MFRAEKLRCHLGSSCYLPILAVFFWVILHPLLQKLKLTWNLKMDGWEKTFILRWPVFRGYGYGSFRECNCTTRIQWKVHPRKLTWNLKMDGWEKTFILRWPVFRGYGYGSFRECNCTTRIQWKVHPRKLTWNLKMDGFSQKEISSSIGLHFQLPAVRFLLGGFVGFFLRGSARGDTLKPLRQTHQ